LKKQKNKKNKMQNGNIELASAEEQLDDLYLHIKELSALKYEAELRREDSIIQQASHMQTAFSFMSAALLMSASIFLEYRHNLISMKFLLISYSSILFCLLASLLFASLAQRRVVKATFMSIPDIINFVEKHQSSVLRKSEQRKQWAQVVGDVQTSLEEVNERRVQQIRWSMGLFFVSLGLIVFWFIYGIAKIIK